MNLSFKIYACYNFVPYLLENMDYIYQIEPKFIKLVNGFRYLTRYGSHYYIFCWYNIPCYFNCGFTHP